MTKRLGKLELEVMKIIWSKDKATIRQVWEKLYPEKKLAYTTVATVTRKVEEKGFLAHEKQDRTYVYTPLIKQAEVSQSMLRELIDRLFDGSAAQMVTALVQSKELTLDDIERIQRFVREQSGETRDA